MKNDTTADTDTRESVKHTVHIGKQVAYKYSNVIVAVFATIVLGELVDGDQISQKEVTDKLIVRLDHLGYLPLMHQLSETPDFTELLAELVEQKRPWNEALSTLAHVALYFFNGAEGMLAKRNTIRRQVADEARAGCSTSEALAKALRALLDPKPDDADAPPITLN